MIFRNLILLTLSITFLASSYAQDKPELSVGGALRFNYNYSSWKNEQQEMGGDLIFDVFRINSKVSYKGVKLNAEYRFYSAEFGGGMLKQGWIGYDLTKKDNIQLGLTQVPFGITTYNSHSWFFSLNYYVGLEDDHDFGLKYSHNGENIEFNLAFFKNSEALGWGGPNDVSHSRYSYDIASWDTNNDGTEDILRNKEVNQINGKFLYKTGDAMKHKIGVSGQYGGLYNIDQGETGSHYAVAGHYELNVGNFDLKAQVSYYNYDPKNPDGETDDVVSMTAYGAPYLVASKATLYTIGAAYAFPVEWGPVSNIQVYNDFGMMAKGIDGFEDTMMNDFGFLVTAGSVYTYIDFAAGKDQPWLGPNWTNGLGEGTPGGAGWDMRFNINFGYYF